LESLFFANLTSPPLLFFFLGTAAALLRSDLEIPAQIAKFLSLYLLFAIGFKGGVSLSESGFDTEVAQTLIAAVALASLVPVGGFYLLRRRLGAADAAAVAATYGSISAVTFVTATSYLDAMDVSWSGHLVAAMALMEAPAIIIGLLLYRLHTQADDASGGFEWRELIGDSLLNGSVFLILGSLLIGWLTGERGMQQVSPFIGPPFVGVLCLFLLDMGIVAGRAGRRAGGIRDRVSAGQRCRGGGPGVGPGPGRRQRAVADRARGQRFLHRRAGGDAAGVAGSESEPLSADVAGHHVSIQHSDRHSAVPPRRAWSGGGLSAEKVPMKPCKRLEIVIEQQMSRRLAERLDDLGVPGYTVISQASGRGDRGTRQADEISGALTNCIYLIACPDEAMAERIVEGIRPLLTRSGGICMMSDAMWLRH